MAEMKEKLLCAWILLLIASSAYVMFGAKSKAEYYNKTCQQCMASSVKPVCTPAETVAACAKK